MATGKKVLCPDSKTCTQCLTEKPLEDFYEGRGKYGRKAACIPCANKYTREYWARNRERFKQYREDNLEQRTDYYRQWRLERRFKLTVADYDEILQAQLGVCAICQGPPIKNRLAVDHDHSCCPGRETCGQCVRGLLCSSCNARLGVLEDRAWRVKAEEYLAR